MKKTEDQSINNREWCNTRRVILLVMEPRSSLWRRRVNQFWRRRRESAGVPQNTRRHSLFRHYLLDASHDAYWICINRALSLYYCITCRYSKYHGRSVICFASPWLVPSFYHLIGHHAKGIVIAAGTNNARALLSTVDDVPSYHPSSKDVQVLEQEMMSTISSNICFPSLAKWFDSHWWNHEEQDGPWWI
jgi:hypothetical protein